MVWCGHINRKDAFRRAFGAAQSVQVPFAMGGGIGLDRPSPGENHSHDGDGIIIENRRDIF